MLTDAECKQIIVKIARKHGVKPAKITTLLMSEEDKQDMREGKLDFFSLEAHISVWKEYGTKNMNQKSKLRG